MHEGSDGSSKHTPFNRAGAASDDRVVLGFVKGHVFDPANCVIRTDGGCRLNPEMARTVVAKVSDRKPFDADG